MKRLRWALLVAVPLCAYATAAWNGFVWDDHRVILGGRLIGSLRNLPTLFRHDTTFNSDGGRYEARATVDTYRPLTMSTFFLEHALFGKHPAPYHIDSVLIHVANVILLFLVALRLRVSERAALWAALVFAAHPSIAEAVHWVNGRSDPLSVLFFLSAMFMWLDGHSVRAALLVFAGTLCKETTFLLLPPLLLLRRHQPKSWVWAYGPLAAGAAAGLILRLVALGHLAATSGGSHLPFAAARTPHVWLDGLRSLLLPSPSMPPSLHEQYRTVSVGLVVAGALVVTLLAMAAVWAWRRGRDPPVFAFVTFLLVTSPIAMLSFGEGWSGWGRYLYPAAPFVCLALACMIVDEALPRARPALTQIAMHSGAILIAIIAIITCIHGRDWRDDRVFAEASIRDHPDHSFGYAALAVAEMQQRPDRALAAAGRAVSIAPDFARHWSLVANALMKLGRTRDSALAAKRALAIDPTDVNSRYVLAIVRMRERNENEAARLLIGVLADEPTQDGPWQTLQRAVRKFGPSSTFVTTLRGLADKPRYAHVASRVAAQLQAGAPEP